MKQYQSDPRMYDPPHWTTTPILWRNGQWAVTRYGIENVAGPCHYHISAKLLTAGWWREHMAAKNWVDAALFDECYAHAVRIHNARGTCAE